MTLVVTSASENGITVVGDRALTLNSPSGVKVVEARKVWYVPRANIALAFWGNARLPDGETFQDWVREFVSQVGESDNVSSVCQRLVDELNPKLERLGRLWSSMRSGIHVSGFDGDLPIIFHVHTGDPKAYHHRLEVHRDFPDLYGGGHEVYRNRISSGDVVQLRSGYYELFVTLARAAFEAREQLSSLLGGPVPARTLKGQAAFDEALVRLAAGILKSAQLTQSISEELDVIAFTPGGIARL